MPAPLSHAVVRARGRKLALQVLLCFAGACMPWRSSAYARFYTLPVAEREEAIVQQPLNEQLDVYVYGLKRIKPLPTYIGNAIGRQGRAVIRPIVSRLATESADHVRLGLILALASLPCPDRDLVSVHGLLRELFDIVESFDDPSAMATAHFYLNRLGQRCS
jgi:hypothetical protein